MVLSLSIGCDCGRVRAARGLAPAPKSLPHPTRDPLQTRLPALRASRLREEQLHVSHLLPLASKCGGMLLRGPLTPVEEGGLRGFTTAW